MNDIKYSACCSSDAEAVSMTCCGSDAESSSVTCCGEIAGTDIDCRVFSANGETHEIPTEEMLADAILKSLSAAHTPEKNPYVLPDNLRRFFEGKKEKDQDCCCS